MLVKKDANHLLFTSIGPVSYPTAFLSVSTRLLRQKRSNVAFPTLPSFGGWLPATVLQKLHN